MQAIRNQGYKADWDFSSVCDSAAEITITLSKFINLFAHLTWKHYGLKSIIFHQHYVVGVNGSRNTPGMEKLPRIIKKLQVSVSSSSGHCPHPGDGSGKSPFLLACVTPLQGQRAPRRAGRL